MHTLKSFLFSLLMALILLTAAGMVADVSAFAVTAAAAPAFGAEENTAGAAAKEADESSANAPSRLSGLAEELIAEGRDPFLASFLAPIEFARNPLIPDDFYPRKEHVNPPAYVMDSHGGSSACLQRIIEELETYGSAKPSDPLAELKVLALYRRLLEESAAFYTRLALTEANYDDDVTREDLSEEVLTMSGEYSELSDRASQALGRVLEGPYGKILAREMSGEDEEYFKTYQPMTKKEKALEEEDQRLVHEYNRLMSGDETLEELNPQAGEIYRELVRIRLAAAEEAGYQTYPRYADEVLYNRDYNSADLLRLRAAVKEYLVPVYDRWCAETADDIVYEHRADAGEILRDLAPCIADLHPRLTEAFSYLRRNHLYNFDESPTKQDAGYTNFLPAYGSAFIFNRAAGGKQDYDTMIHEFGHYNAIYHDDQEFLLAEDNLDVDEIHSQGLEMLFLPYYDELFGSDARALRDSQVTSMIESVLYGCLFDEFQRTVYGHPEMTVEQMNRLYGRLLREYGLVAGTPAKAGEAPSDPEWITVSHTFELPMYYISYATSALTALEFYLMAEEDRAAAVDKYMELTALGCGAAYREAIQICELPDIFREGTVKDMAGKLNP